MESDQGGDLGDIIRASRGCGGTVLETTTTTTDWQFPSLTSLSEPINFPSPTTEAVFNSGFGDPFFNLGRDPFMLHELSARTAAESSITGHAKMGIEVGNGHVGVGGGYGGSSMGNDSDFATQKMMLLGDDRIGNSNPCNNILSRFLEISPTSSPVVSRGSIRHQPPIFLAAAAASASDMMNITCIDNVSSRCLPDHAPGLQISSSSSPRTPGVKRRKSQAKKVVCIPAPAASGSRPTGEVVPSDLWAWRKYGQKPIKGSPYPRGYYRCSSSKGCPARKQVERSRSDPNMLVITYTSEHNHPWPTQRNALAGSTRAQAAKTNGWSSRNSGQKHNPRVSGQEDKHKEMANSSAPVKEEAVEMEKTPVSSIDMTDDNYNYNYNYNLDHDTVLSQNNYKSSYPECCRSDDFFAELAEFDGGDPLEMFSKQLLEEKPDDDEEEQEEEEDDEDDEDEEIEG